MNFSHFNFVHLIWLLPPFIILVFLSEMKRKKNLENMFSKKIQKIVIFPSPKKNLYHYLLIFFSYLFLIFTLMGPRWGFKVEEIELKGRDIVIALDVSNSMLASDIKPSRLEMAKREIKNLIKKMAEDRVALVLFAGSSFVSCPLTADYDAFLNFLENANVNSISIQGTDLFSALDKSLQLLRRSKSGSAGIILITDGEDHSGKFFMAVEEAVKENVKLFIMGIGTPDGSPIPLPDGGFLKDKKGNLVITKLDEDSLKEAALKTGGAYIRVSSGGFSLDELYENEIKPVLSGTKLGEKTKKVWEERFQYPLFAAIFLLALFLIFEVRN